MGLSPPVVWQIMNFQGRIFFISIFAARPLNSFIAMAARSDNCVICSVPWVMSTINCSLQVNSSVVKSWIKHCPVKPRFLLILVLISVWATSQDSRAGQWTFIFMYMKLLKAFFEGWVYKGFASWKWSLDCTYRTTAVNYAKNSYELHTFRVVL